MNKRRRYKGMRRRKYRKHLDFFLQFVGMDRSERTQTKYREALKQINHKVY